MDTANLNLYEAAALLGLVLAHKATRRAQITLLYLNGDEEVFAGPTGSAWDFVKEQLNSKP